MTSNIKIALLFAGVAAAPVALAAAPSADEIVQHHIAALGGEKNLDAVQSFIIRGTYTEHGQSSPAQLARMRIEVNRKLDASMFMPPQLQRTPLQTAMDQIFQERDDADAVQWTYHDFRNAYPETNTEAAMEVIGYQSLKMGGIAAAVALLEHNRHDYPQSAGAAFGLGRAYKAAGR